MFRLRLSTAYITTAKIYIIVFYCLFQDSISEFNRCFPIRYLGFYHCLCISYAPLGVMIFLRIAPHPFVFTHIIWDLLGWISGSNMSALRFLTLFLEFVTGRTGPRETRAPGPFPGPAPLNGLGWGVFFGIPCPSPRLGPCPTLTPAGSPLKIGGNKEGPGQGMNLGGPWIAPGWGLPETYPLAPSKSGVWHVKTCPAPPCNEY